MKIRRPSSFFGRYNIQTNWLSINALIRPKTNFALSNYPFSIKFLSQKKLSKKFLTTTKIHTIANCDLELFFFPKYVDCFDKRMPPFKRSCFKVKQRTGISHFQVTRKTKARQHVPSRNVQWCSKRATICLNPRAQNLLNSSSLK